MRKANAKVILFSALSVCVAMSAYAATTVDRVMKESQAAIQDGQASQQRVEVAASQTQDMVSDYRQASKINEDLAIYNKKLELQVSKQQEQLQKINGSMQNVNEIQGRLLPLAIKMVERLEQFIELDMPFSMKERKDRIAMLKANIDKPDLTVAEKFRQVLEAYQIENEYGRMIRTYQGSIPMVVKGKKSTRSVNILQVGRIALLYQTSDGRETGAWDKKAKKWVELDSGKYRNVVQKGIRIANKQASLDIMELPIAAPEVFK